MTQNVGNRPRVVVVGSVNVDMVVKSSRLPAPGETMTGGRFLMAPGGKGANQAVAAARLGAAVTLVAKVGRDVFGDQAVAGFEREGMNTAAISRDPEQATGVALILVDERGENLISVASGANHRLTPEDVERSADVIRSASVLLLQLETPLETVCRAAEIAATAGVTVILDPAPAPAKPLPRELFEHVDYLTPNEAEAAQLTGLSVHDEASARAAAKELLDAGARGVIITLGAAGVLTADPARMELIPSIPVAAIDTTAAGDAFNGAFAWALAQGLPTETAVRQACLAAAISTTRLGAQPSLPTADELKNFVQE
jgi:ribokinase